MADKKPELVACTFDSSETPKIIDQAAPPQVISCTFGKDSEPKEGCKDEEECKKKCGTPPSCPKCGKADNVIKIVFGMPSPEMLKHSEDGHVALGGCCPPMDGEKPRNYKCKTCNEEF